MLLGKMTILIPIITLFTTQTTFTIATGNNNATNRTTTTSPTIPGSYTLHLGAFDWAGLDGTTDTYGGDDSRCVSLLFPLAVKHFNERRVDLIPDLSRVLQCNKNMTLSKFCDDGGDGLRAARDTIWMTQTYKVDAFCGFASVDSSFSGSMIAQKLGIPTIDHWTSSMRTSDKHDFPMYARTIPSDAANADMIIQLLLEFGYKRVALLVMSDAEDFGRYMFDQLKSFGVTATIISFTYGAEDTIASSVSYLATLELNVVVAATWMGLIPEVANACAAHNLLGRDKLWIFTYMSRAPNANDYANPNVSALWHGSFWVRPLLSNNPNWDNFVQHWPSFQADAADINAQFPPYGLGNSATDCENAAINMQLRPDFFSNTVDKQIAIWSYVYDAVLAWGFAMCKDNLNGPVPSGETLYANVLNNPFVGLSGTSMKFNAQGDRDPYTSGFSVSNWNHTDLQNVGIWNVEQNKFVLDWDAIVFRNGPGLRNLPPYDITPPPHNMNLIPPWAQILGYVETCVVFACALAALIWLELNNKLNVVILSQPLFMRLIVLGVLCLGAAIIPLTMEYNDDACMTFPWMACFGLSLSVAPIAVKSLRVGILWYNPGFKRGRSTTKSYCAMILVVLFVDVILLICWTAIDPLVYERFTVLSDVWQNPMESFGTCQGKSDVSIGFLSALLTFNGLLAIATVAISMWVSNAPEKFHEARWTAVAAVALGQAYFFGIPVVAAVFVVPLARFLVLSSLCFITAMSLLGTMFLPKILAGRQEIIQATKQRLSSNEGGSPVLATARTSAKVERAASPVVNPPQDVGKNDGGGVGGVTSRVKAIRSEGGVLSGGGLPPVSMLDVDGSTTPEQIPGNSNNGSGFAAISSNVSSGDGIDSSIVGGNPIRVVAHLPVVTMGSTLSPPSTLMGGDDDTPAAIALT